MANILDYLDWRGDLAFAVSPFNEVDNYILAKLGCPDYGGVVPEEGQVPLSLAAERTLTGPEQSLGALSSPLLARMILRAAATERFGHLRIGDYVNKIDPQKEEQFSALTIWLPDGSRYVSFRGTDDTLLAWKEDFLLGVEEEIPAQRDAADYLLRQAEKEPGPLIVGGHSKGGNLAVYAAMTAPDAVQRRVKAVYNNDGPGFRRAVTGLPEYQRIRDRVHTLAPQYTTVGVLLYCESRYTIVRAEQPGVAAHDGLRWLVKGTAFERCEAFSPATLAFRDAMEELCNQMDTEQRRRTVASLFELLQSTGAKTITDLTERRLRQGLAMAGQLRQAPEVRRFVVKLLELMVRQTLEGVKKRTFGRFRQNKEE